MHVRKHACTHASMRTRTHAHTLQQGTLLDMQLLMCQKKIQALVLLAATQIRAVGVWYVCLCICA